MVRPYRDASITRNSPLLPVPATDLSASSLNLAPLQGGGHVAGHAGGLGVCPALGSIVGPDLGPTPSYVKSHVVWLTSFQGSAVGFAVCHVIGLAISPVASTAVGPTVDRAVTSSVGSVVGPAVCAVVSPCVGSTVCHAVGPDVGLLLVLL